MDDNIISIIEHLLAINIFRHYITFVLIDKKIYYGVYK